MQKSKFADGQIIDAPMCAEAGVAVLTLSRFRVQYELTLPRFHVPSRSGSDHRGLAGDRRKKADRGMQALAIVIAFDSIDDIQASLRSRFVADLVDPLDFQGLEEAFHRGVVPRIGPATH